MELCPPVKLQHASAFFWDLNRFTQCATADLGSKVSQFFNTALCSSLNALTFDLNCELVCLESVDTLNAAFGFREQEHPPLGYPDVSLCLCLCAYTVDEGRKKKSAYLGGSLKNCWIITMYSNHMRPLIPSCLK